MHLTALEKLAYLGGLAAILSSFANSIKIYEFFWPRLMGLFKKSKPACVRVEYDAFSLPHHGAVLYAPGNHDVFVDGSVLANHTNFRFFL
jgi:hypothetical protein